MVQKLRLNTLQNAKQSYNRIIQAYLRDEIPTDKARCLGYLLTGVLQYWKLEADLQIEQRLAAIEAALEDR